MLHWISKLFIDTIHILFLFYLLLWFWDFLIENLQDFITISRALIKDIFLVAEATLENLGTDSEKNTSQNQKQNVHTISTDVCQDLANSTCTSSTWQQWAHLNE